MKYITVIIGLVLSLNCWTNAANASLIVTTPLATTDYNEPNSTFWRASIFAPQFIGTNYTFTEVGTDLNWGANFPEVGYLYQNGGANGYIEIATNGGLQLTGLQFNISNGWRAATQFIWLQTFRNGLSTGYEFDVELSNFGLLTIMGDNGTSFDAVRLMVFDDEATRNLHDETSFSAASITNVQGLLSTVDVPEPNTVVILSTCFALLILRRVKVGVLAKVKS